MNQKKIGKFIQERRKLKELTQVELAERLGVSNRTVSKWETGQNLPDYSLFQSLCDELDISINELLSGEKLSDDNYQKKLEENFVNTIEYNNKKRNKRIKKCIIFIILLVIIYLLYKIFITYFLYADYNNRDDKSFPINKNIETVKIRDNGKANTLVLNELDIYIPEDFKLVTDKAKLGFVVDNCEPYVKNLTDKNAFDAMIFVCSRQFDDVHNLDYHGIHSTLFPWLDVYPLLEKYNIHDTIDMIKYYESHFNKKQNIFTSSNDIKVNYIVTRYASTVIPSYDKFYYFENDLRGYSIESFTKNYFQQAVVSYMDNAYNERTYGISFHNGNEEYFNHENSFEIINSISRR